MNAAMQRQHGFSLIEVLIAVLVLAIGMLGLGAVFPAIIAEQRASFEVIEGENAAAAAAALITNREMIDFSFVDESFNKSQDDPDNSYEHVWVLPDFGPGAFAWSNTQLPETDISTGLWSYDFAGRLVTDANRLRQTQLPMIARLYPQPYSGKEPRFVWDLAMRREPGGNRIQVAIFVRRIDARLRVPRGYSLSDVLTGSNNVPTGQLMPVAVNGNSGLPAADDGAGDKFYAVLQTLAVEVYGSHLDWLVFTHGRDASVDTSVGFATKIGQKLVDNTGVVRTVVEIPTVDPGDPLVSEFSNKRVVRVEPPFTFANAGGDDTDDVAPGVNALNTDYDDERASWVRQVIFTPRTPVAVRIVTLEGGS